MPQEFIEIRGARENNLKDISLTIPKRKITIFTGVSGSGKSSIVFDTIATEAQRLLNENFSMFVRNAILIDQSAVGTNSRSNPATYTGILDEVKLPCEVCGGKRFKDEVLDYKYKGRSISDVLGMKAHV